jgi:hypothetical protein
MEGSAAGFVVPVLFIGMAVVFIAGLWKTFTKAGKPGWACLVPIYNIIVMLEIAGRPLWWLLLLFIPIVNFFVSLVVVIDMAKAFGKGAGFGLGMFFLGPIFYPILGFGSAQHVGAPAR